MRLETRVLSESKEGTMSMELRRRSLRSLSGLKSSGEVSDKVWAPLSIMMPRGLLLRGREPVGLTDAGCGC